MSCTRPPAWTLDLPDVVYVARVGGRRVMASGIAVGTRIPAYVSAHGRVLLAGLPDDRLHSPNEKCSLRQLHLGVETSIAFLHEYAATR